MIRIHVSDGCTVDVPHAARFERLRAAAWDAARERLQRSTACPVDSAAFDAHIRHPLCARITRSRADFHAALRNAATDILSNDADAAAVDSIIRDLDDQDPDLDDAELFLSTALWCGVGLRDDASR